MISQTSALYYLPSWMQPTRTHNTSGFLVHSCLYCPTSHLVSRLPHSPHRHEKRLPCRSHHPLGFQRPPHQPPPRTSATAIAHNVMSTKDHSPHVFQRRCFNQPSHQVGRQLHWNSTAKGLEFTTARKRFGGRSPSSTSSRRSPLSQASALDAAKYCQD
jgi:hypothetical protein